MAEFRFYCVSRGRTSRVLRVMLEKTLERGERSVVRLSSVRREEELDIFLWMDPAEGFLPHGRAGKLKGSEEDFTAEQPILLTTTKTEGIENGARVLFHWQEGSEGGIDIGGDGERFDLCCFLHEEGDGDAGVIAEGLWGRLSSMGGNENKNKIGFWYQEGGGWRRRGEEQVEEKVEDKVEEQIEEKQQAEEEVADGAEISVNEPSQESCCSYLRVSLREASLALLNKRRTSCVLLVARARKTESPYRVRSKYCARQSLALLNKRLRALRVEKRAYARSADAGSSWGEFIPPHPPRTLRVRMFCVP